MQPEMRHLLQRIPWWGTDCSVDRNQIVCRGCIRCLIGDEMPAETNKSVRRYDVDWVRTLALGLLIIYHAVISFLPWGGLAFFPVNEDTLDWLWVPMSAVNIWRIPILFLISGMGVRFAMERRNWHQLLGDRTFRILVPLLFGSLTVVPLALLAVFAYSDVPLSYAPSPGHLWFLLNIFVYVLLLLGFFTRITSKAPCFSLGSTCVMSSRGTIPATGFGTTAPTM